MKVTTLVLLTLILASPLHAAPVTTVESIPGNPHRLVETKPDQHAGLRNTAPTIEGSEQTHSPSGLELEILAGFALPGERSADKWQNNDILVSTLESDVVDPTIVALADGTLFVAAEHTGTTNRQISIYRSVDGGESWEFWFWAIPTEDASNLSLAAGEGNQNRLLLAFQAGTGQITLLWIDLDEGGAWGMATIHSEPTGVANPRLVTDTCETGSWSAFVVFNSRTALGWELCFSKSVDFGATWSTPSVLTGYCDSSGSYPYDGAAGRPAIDYGSGMLYVAYDDYGSPCTGNNRGIYVLSSADFGVNWSSPVRLTPETDDAFDPAVAVVKESFVEVTVAVAYTQFEENVDQILVNVTQDNGTTWLAGGICLSCEMSYGWLMNAALTTSVSQGRIHAVYWTETEGGYALVSYRSAEASNPLVWSTETLVGLANSGTEYTRPCIAVNPSQPVADEVCIAWTVDAEEFRYISFDAPSTVGVGVVEIDLQPAELDAPWTLLGDGVFYSTFYTGDGYAYLTDMNDGWYQLTWEAVPGWSTPPDPEIQNLVEGSSITFSGTYYRYAPVILEIADVPDDQGRQVLVSWEGSQHDGMGGNTTIRGYDIYQQSPVKTESERGPATRTPEGWISMGWIAAHGEPTYTFFSPTFCDSTDTGVCPSTFFIRATTNNPLTFFDSDPVAGYSVDNLVPSVPGNPRLAGPSQLAWDGVPDPDFQYFSVYSSETETFDDYELVGTTIETELDVTGSEGLFLAVTAKDFAGNESDLSVALFNATNVDGTPPYRYVLEQNIPNPFNPSTEIRFELADKDAVELRVYDLEGSLVKSLIRGTIYPSGKQSVTWDGLDDDGRPLVSGVYFYKLDIGDFSQIRKMTLLK